MAAGKVVDPRALRLRVDAELWVFLAAGCRRDEFVAGWDGQSSLGHVVEALGVPLTEVGGLVVDGGAVDAGWRPSAGETVEVRTVARPQRVDGWTGRFLLDVHLGTLARRLRVLGVDTAYRNDAADAALVDEANAQRRLLLTRDRGLLRRRALWAGAYVRGDHPGDQLADVLARFAPPLHPWTRCTSCNGLLRPATKSEVQAELEPGTRRTYDTFARCRACHQVYWHGAHSPRLDALVATARSDGS